MCSVSVNTNQNHTKLGVHRQHELVLFAVNWASCLNFERLRRILYQAMCCAQWARERERVRSAAADAAAKRRNCRSRRMYTVVCTRCCVVGALNSGNAGIAARRINSLLFVSFDRCASECVCVFVVPSLSFPRMLGLSASSRIRRNICLPNCCVSRGVCFAFAGSTAQVRLWVMHVLWWWCLVIHAGLQSIR